MENWTIVSTCINFYGIDEPVKPVKLNGTINTQLFLNPQSCSIILKFPIPMRQLVNTKYELC
jgi:hypothetical protein